MVNLAYQIHQVAPILLSLVCQIYTRLHLSRSTLVSQIYIRLHPSRSTLVSDTLQALAIVTSGSPSRGGDVAVFAFDISQRSLLIPFYSVLVFFFFFCLFGPFNCISFHKFSE